MVVPLVRLIDNPDFAEGPDARYTLSEAQAKAILELRLQRLTGLEREKLLQEYQEILALIGRLKEILASEKLVLEIISTELREIREAYGDARRTEIIPDTSEISIEDLVADEDMVITVSRGGYIKRSPLSMYRSQRRGGKGRIGMQTKEEDIVEHLFVASTHAYVLVFTDRGRLYWLKVYAVPEVASNARGKAIVNLLPLEQNESVRALLTTRDFTEGKYVVMSTRGGKIKKTELAAFSNVRASGIIAIDILEGDDLHSVALSDGQSDIFVGTHGGRAIRFSELEVRPMGRGAAGVRAISLRGDDHVVEMDVLPAGQGVPPAVSDDEIDADIEIEVDAEETETDPAEAAADEIVELTGDNRGYIFTVTEKGFGKRTPVGAYPVKHRGGYGVIDIKVTERNGNVAGIANVVDDDQVLLITEQGMIIRVPVEGIRSIGRNTQGVRVIHIDETDTVVAAVKVVDKEQPEDENGGEDIPQADEEPIH
jgi:DNA gyrase subunit A